MLKQFAKGNPTATEPLNRWYDVAKHADWQNYSDIKNDFNAVDSVGNDRFVFNIKGNSFRLVVMIFFDIRTIFIRFIGLHKEYDKINCSTI